jgi:acyl-CoA reductase-like NAD-dependent aldehyde dehydrogenase
LKYLDNECFGVICGGVETTTHLLDQAWDKIFFTGSPRVGKIVMAAAAKNLTSVTLELGGKSPVIVDDTVTDLALVARRICWGKCSNAGQTCIAPDYIICHEKMYDKLVAELKATLLKFFGDEIQKSNDFARIISDGHCQRLKVLLEENKGLKFYNFDNFSINLNKLI